jgi:hypothetical protein
MIDGSCLTGFGFFLLSISLGIASAEAFLQPFDFMCWCCYSPDFSEVLFFADILPGFKERSLL